MMTEVKLSEVLDQGGDVLLVKGYVDGQWCEVQGWVSATTNHYDEPRGPKSKPRAMTTAEQRAYFEGLLLGAAGVATTQAPEQVLFMDPNVQPPAPESAPEP